MVPLPFWNEEITSNTRDSKGPAWIADLICSMFWLIMIPLKLWVLTMVFPPNSSKCFNICDFLALCNILEMRLFLDGENSHYAKIIWPKSDQKWHMWNGNQWFPAQGSCPRLWRCLKRPYSFTFQSWPLNPTLDICTLDTGMLNMNSRVNLFFFSS